MRPCEVIEAFPFVELCIEINVACVGQELVELLFVGAMRSPDVAVELRRCGPDVGVANALILDGVRAAGWSAGPSSAASRWTPAFIGLDAIVRISLQPRVDLLVGVALLSRRR